MPETSSTKDSRIDLRVTQKEIEASEKLILSNQDRDLFLSALENPPQLQGKLKTAIKKYQDKYGD